MCNEREVSKCRFLILQTFFSLVTLLLGGLISYYYKFISLQLLEMFNLLNSSVCCVLIIRDSSSSFFFLGLNVIVDLILLQQEVINCVSFNEHLKFSIVVCD